MNEALSPQGYNITMDPTNNNPFWDNEPAPTPQGSSYSVTNRIPTGLWMTPMQYGEYNMLTTLIGGYLTAGFDVMATPTLSNKYRINSYTTASDAETKVVYYYYNDMIEQDYNTDQWFIQRITDLKMAAYLNNVGYRVVARVEFGDAGEEAYDAIDNIEVPSYFKVIKCVMIADDNTFGPIIYIPTIEKIEGSATYPLMSGKVTFTEDE